MRRTAAKEVYRIDVVILRILASCTAIYIAFAAYAFADDTGLYTVDGVPLYIDGTQSKTAPSKLSPALLDQVKTVTTLGDALRILGPAYIAPDDSLHIPIIISKTALCLQSGHKATRRCPTPSPSILDLIAECLRIAAQT